MRYVLAALSSHKHDLVSETGFGNLRQIDAKMFEMGGRQERFETLNLPFGYKVWALPDREKLASAHRLFNEEEIGDVEYWLQWKRRGHGRTTCFDFAINFVWNPDFTIEGG